MEIEFPVLHARWLGLRGSRAPFRRFRARQHRVSRSADRRGSRTRASRSWAWPTRRCAFGRSKRQLRGDRARRPDAGAVCGTRASSVSAHGDLHASAEYRQHLLGQLRRSAMQTALAAAAGSSPMQLDIAAPSTDETTRPDVEPRLLLSDFLRDTLGLTGTHVGCEHGVCGACTVLMNGDSVRSCLMLAVQADGAEITTVEGLGRRKQLNVLQAQFREHHGLQCGFCTPGMLMTARPAAEISTRHRRRDPGGAVRQSLPLHRIPEHRGRDQERGGLAPEKTHETEFPAAGRLRMKKSIYVPGADRSETIDLPSAAP